MDTHPADGPPAGRGPADDVDGPLLLSDIPARAVAPVSTSDGPDSGDPPPDVDGTDPGDPDPGDPALPRRHRRRWVGRAAAVVLTIVLVVALGIGVDANAHLRRTDATLDHTRTELHHAMALLTSARTHLAEATTEDDDAGATLAADTAALDSVQAQLVKAQANESEQGVNISDLDTCLSGVEQALNEISLSDQTGAGTTLGRVANACTSAEPSS